MNNKIIQHKFLNIIRLLNAIKCKDKIIYYAFWKFKNEHSEYNIMGIYKEIAGLAGISIMSVRRVVTNKNKQTAIKTHKNVPDIIDK